MFVWIEFQLNLKCIIKSKSKKYDYLNVEIYMHFEWVYHACIFVCALNCALDKWKKEKKCKTKNIKYWCLCPSNVYKNVMDLCDITYHRMYHIITCEPFQMWINRVEKKKHVLIMMNRRELSNRHKSICVFMSFFVSMITIYSAFMRISS